MCPTPAGRSNGDSRKLALHVPRIAVVVEDLRSEPSPDHFSSEQVGRIGARPCSNPVVPLPSASPSAISAANSGPRPKRRLIDASLGEEWKQCDFREPGTDGAICGVWCCSKCNAKGQLERHVAAQHLAPASPPVEAESPQHRYSTRTKFAKAPQRRQTAECRSCPSRS